MSSGPENCAPPRSIDGRIPGFDALAAIIGNISSRGRVLALLALSAACFVLIINSSWNATPDSALYLSLGESLAKGQGYVFNGEPHTLAAPGFPLMIAAVARTLGPSFLHYRILMALTGLLAAWLGYLFVRRACGPDVALLTAGVFTVNHALLSNSTLMLADAPFALFFLVALHGILSASQSDRRLSWALLAGLAVGLLPIVRINGLGVPPVAAFYLFLRWKDAGWPRRLLAIAVFIAAALAPWLLWQYIKASFPASAAEGTYFAAVGSRRLEEQLLVILSAFVGYFGEISYALTGLTLRTGVLELIAPALVGIGALQAWRNGDRLLVPLTAVQMAGLSLSSAGSRYLLFLLPGMYLFMALGVAFVGNRLLREPDRARKVGRLLVAVFVFMGVCNLGHDLITIGKARTALEAEGPESERSLPFFAAARWLKANAPDATALTTRSRIIHYLSGVRTVTLLRSGVPEREVWVSQEERIKELLDKTKPDFLYTDSSMADLYDHVIRTMEGMGMTLTLVPEATVNQRFQLFRIQRRE